MRSCWNSLFEYSDHHALNFSVGPKVTKKIFRKSEASEDGKTPIYKIADLSVTREILYENLPSKFSKIFFGINTSELNGSNKPLYLTSLQGILESFDFNIHEFEDELKGYLSESNLLYVIFRLNEKLSNFIFNYETYLTYSFLRENLLKKVKSSRTSEYKKLVDAVKKKASHKGIPWNKEDFESLDNLAWLITYIVYSTRFNKIFNS